MLISEAQADGVEGLLLLIDRVDNLVQLDGSTLN